MNISRQFSLQFIPALCYIYLQSCGIERGQVGKKIIFVQVELDCIFLSQFKNDLCFLEFGFFVFVNLFTVATIACTSHLPLLEKENLYGRSNTQFSAS